MDDARKMYLYTGGSSSSAIYMTSDTMYPQQGNEATGLPGAWRAMGVVFYCTDYARTDLTACNSQNRATMYFSDPNPNACWGTATQVSSNKYRLGQACSSGSQCCSGQCVSSVCAAGCETAGDYGTAQPTPTPTPTLTPGPILATFVCKREAFTCSTSSSCSDTCTNQFTITGTSLVSSGDLGSCSQCSTAQLNPSGSNAGTVSFTSGLTTQWRNSQNTAWTGGYSSTLFVDSPNPSGSGVCTGTYDCSGAGSWTVSIPVLALAMLAHFVF